ncbi:hypothetical protein [Burkholderia guangdongensis]|uniref:hypothetical protein n=1 Tax=Burkholderia guangdongensis TaxID=1792500 RepID=UPI0015CE17BF|nr:hypothetical protein [Burkholderia guangdongensis]
MKSKTSFEWFRWMHNALLWLIIMGICIPISELIAGPALQWLLYDIPYQLPTWNRAGRMAVFIVLFSLFAGTVTWFCEKKRSGR